MWSRYSWATKIAGNLRFMRTAAFVAGFVALASLQLAAWALQPAISTWQPSSNPVENPIVPPGTILPIRLDGAISIKDIQRGQAIEAKMAQEVPLPSASIALRTNVKGSVLAIEKDGEGEGIAVTLKFHQLESRNETYPISTSLRAIASYSAVRAAQMPLAGADSGTPSGWGDTVLIGGDIRYGDGGAVRNRAKQKVGKGVRGGVLVYVHANLTLGCNGPLTPDQPPQALWVFSSDACGVYDLKGVKISRTGNAAPVGEITLHFDKPDMKLESGTGLLLRIVPRS